jgi:hypothetical protein
MMRIQMIADILILAVVFVGLTTIAVVWWNKIK